MLLDILSFRHQHTIFNFCKFKILKESHRRTDIFKEEKKNGTGIVSDIRISLNGMGPSVFLASDQNVKFHMWKS